MQYLIWSNEHGGWWGPNLCGYTVRIDAAGRYSRSDAIQICANARHGAKRGGAPNEIPVPLRDLEDALLIEKAAEKT